MRDTKKGSPVPAPSRSTRPLRPTKRGLSPLPAFAAGMAMVAGVSSLAMLGCREPRLAGAVVAPTLPPRMDAGAASNTPDAAPPIVPTADIPTAGVPPQPERP